MAKRNRINVCALIGLLMIIVGIIYVIVCTALGLHNRWLYRMIFAAWVMIYLIVTDFIEPLAIDRFKRKSKRQVRAYYVYAILDVIGILGLLWFVVMAGMPDDYTHYAGIAIFVVCFVPKNVFYKKFKQRQIYYDYDESEEDSEEFDISED